MEIATSREVFEKAGAAKLAAYKSFLIHKFYYM